MAKYGLHTDWALASVVEIDRYEVGFCGEFLRASDERRHVIAAYLACGKPRCSQTDGKFLSKSDHRSILTAAFGDVPVGMRGALRRSGPMIHDQQFYHLLYDLLAKPSHAEMTRCIARIPELNLMRLHIVQHLPEWICRANVVLSIDTAEECRDVKTGFNLLVSRGVDPGALATAIRKVRTHREFTNLWKRWVLKARLPQHPVPPSHEYRPIETGHELQNLARNYRNCARRYLPSLFDEEGGDAFAEITHGGHSAVIHLRRDGGDWQLEGIHGHRNRRPREGLRERISQYLEAHGVRTRLSARNGLKDWAALERLMSRHRFGFE